MFKWAMIGGTFDKDGGKPSGYIKKLFEELQDLIPSGEMFNGGDLGKLYYAYRMLGDTSKKESKYDVIFWFAAIDNSESKQTIRNLKKDFPKVLLVTSKRNYDEEYSVQDLIARMLQNKANLMVEFKKEFSGKEFTGTILDPLGNSFGSTTDISHLAARLVRRLIDLKKFTRIGSKPDLILPEGYKKPLVNKDFLDIVKKRASEFHEIIHGANTSRFLGNCSFRCERGFPSFRGEDDIIYVSRRNVDKAYIDEEMFVPVKMGPERTHVSYSGEFKPSVDTPIQAALYQWFRNINYMVHSHCYVDNGGMIKPKIPCGSFEEFFAIVEAYRYRDIDSAYINLYGHGSIVMGSTVDHIKEAKYHARNIPELD